MPLIQPAIQAKLTKEIDDALSKAFKSETSAGADPTTHKKMAEAIAEAVSKVIVEELTMNAMVLPGIPTAGSPASQVTVGPGKIA